MTTMMQKKSLILMLFISMFFISCSDKKEVEIEYNDGLSSFDVNGNENQLLFSFTIGGKSSLFKANIDGSNAKEFVKFRDSISIFKPRYSPDGKRVVFIANKKGNLNYSLWIVNVDGSNLIQLTKAEGIITEATFSFDSNAIYFGKAAAYRSYSPLASRSAHDFDIYYIGLKDKQIKKVTTLNAYQLSDISDINNEKLLFGLLPEGVFFYGKNKEPVLRKVSTNNNKEREPDSYSSPVFINEKLISLVSYYELVIVDLETGKEKMIFSTHGSNQFGTIRSLAKQNRLLFSYLGDFNTIHSISLDGKSTEVIKIAIDKYVRRQRIF